MKNTKFLSLKSAEAIKPKKTIFLKLVCKDGIGANMQSCSPKDYDNVMFLGHDPAYGDVFKAWNEGELSFFIYFGIKGDEFKE